MKSVMGTRIIKIMMILVLLLSTMTSMGEVYATGSFSVSASSTNVNPGATITISLTVSNAAGKFTASSTNSSVVSVNHQPDWGNNNTVTFTVTANAVGSATINVTAVDATSYDDVPVTGTRSVTINVANPATPPPSNNTTPPPSNTSNTNKSNNANVTGLTLSVGQLEPTFNRNTRNYTVYVGNEITEINITPTREDSKATFSVSGNKDLKVGNNTVTVTVTAENGTTKSTYTINVVRADKLLMKLSSLTIKGLNLTPEFDPNIFEYTIELEEFMKSLDITAIAENENTPIEIVGGTDLQEGENLVIIILKSADHSDQTEYRITVIVPEEVIVEDEEEETEENEEEKKGIFGGIFKRPSNNTLAAIGIAVMTLGTITLLIAEKVKEVKTVAFEERKKDLNSLKVRETYDTVTDKVDLLTSSSRTEEDRRPGKHF